MMHAIDGHQPGVITKIGLKTFMDPKQDGGRMNDAAKEDLVELIELGGEEWLLYKAPKKISGSFVIEKISFFMA